VAAHAFERVSKASGWRHFYGPLPLVAGDCPVRQAAGRQHRVLAGVAAALLTLAACGEDTVPGNRAATSATVVQTSVSVPGSRPPANPETGAATPPELNRAYAEVYQLDGVSDAEVKKVLVMMPGFLGGANDFTYLGRRVVLRSHGTTAVWAVDRRSNALEDQTGLDAAEAAKDPDIAKNYYFHGATVGGKTFAGFIDGKTISYAAEWGIKAHIEDLDALISAVIARYPQAAIILGGHSLGGSIVPIYAAWNFGTYSGFERLSGLVLLEGAPNPKGPADIPAQAAYEQTGIAFGGSRTSVHSLRSGDPIVSLKPFVTTDLFVTAEILGMRVSSLVGAADAPSPDADLVARFFTLLFGLPSVPPGTNRAALGFGFDNDYEPLSFARVSMGEAVGPVGPNPNAAFLSGFVGPDDKLLAPIDAHATYDWQPALEQTVPEPTDMETFAHMLFAGPTNFIEWYFPARLTLDVGITDDLNVQPSGDWRKEVYGLAVTENARVDLPVFAVGGSKGLVPDLTAFDPYRQSIAPVLRNGTRRDAVAAGFQTRLQPNYVHLDVLTARDDGEGNGEFAALVEWMDTAVQLAPRK
jgi:pimeloyl-ACP methyl ester carboxylesterase